MRKGLGYSLYDVIERKEIFIPDGKIKEICRELNIDYTTLSKLGITGTYIHGRYILSSDKNKIFTLVHLDTGKEYDCISNKTIFLHFDLPYSDNEAKYVYELRKRRQAHASIAGLVFKLKDGKGFTQTIKMKNNSSTIQDRYNLAKDIKKIKRKLYCRVYNALKRSNVRKQKPVNDLVGCNSKELFCFIQSKFTKNMSWDNKELWDIDHIKPCSEFDLRIKSEQEKCLHYTNLQPMWATTKIAEQMGEVDYVGNRNKHNTGEQYDSYLESIIRNNFPVIDAKDMAIRLFDNGVKKVII